MVFCYNKKFGTWVLPFSGEILGPSGAGGFTVIFAKIDLMQQVLLCTDLKTMSKYSHRATCIEEVLKIIKFLLKHRQSMG